MLYIKMIIQQQGYTFLSPFYDNLTVFNVHL